ncbi:MAG: histidine phosphatase family protein [Synergistaceae bacterium]|jgi:alpha-ribazole phosphatase
MTKGLNIFLMRHAKPDLPHGGRLYYGQTDYPLSKEGETHAMQIGERVKNVKFDGVFASTLLRAKRTAELTVPKYKDEIKTISGLSEIHVGDWEGKSYDEVRTKWEELYDANGNSFASVAPPNGESFKDLQKRTVPAFENIINDYSSGNLLIVAHGGVIWTLICHYFKFELNDIFFYPMDYCGIHMLERTDSFMKLIRYNWNEHLNITKTGY